MKKLMIVAGEASGDLYGAGLIRALKKKLPGLKAFGMGGDLMRSSNVEILADIKEISVVGIVEVFSHLRKIQKAMKLLTVKLIEERPDVLVLIDFPDFNLRLAKKAKSEEIPIIYYISPQVWAWRAKRVKRIAKLIDKMLVVYPFEVNIYRKVGLDTEFVGHPLLDELQITTTPKLIKEEVMKKYGLDPERPVLAILPGSRKREIEVLLPIMLETLNLLRSKDVQAIIPVAPSIDFSRVEELVKGRNVILTRGAVNEVLSISDTALITSGTATLQAAIKGVPMVIIYKVSPLTYLLGKLLVKVKNIGIVNILAGRTIVPELIQSDVTPKKIAGILMNILDNSTYSGMMKRDLLEVKEKLGSPGASDRAAEEIINYISK